MNTPRLQLRGLLPEVLFGVALVAAAVVLVSAGSGLTFYFDEWELILNREGFAPDTIFGPHNGQVFVVPVLVYKALIATFGIESQLPFRLTAVLCVTACSTLLFLYARRRTGPWMALVLTLPVMCLGAGWEALLLPLSINFLVSLGAGLGMLLLLDRGDRSGDIGASLALAVSIAAGGLGIAFAAGAVADVLLRRDPRRAWIPFLPLLAYGLWLLAYGETAAGLVVEAGPIQVLDNVYRSIGAVASAITGLTVERRPLFWLEPVLGTGGQLATGRVLAAVLIGLLTVRLIGLRRWPVSGRTVTVLAVLLTFWLMIAVMSGEERQPEASRYLYSGAILLVAATAALLEGVRLPGWAPLALVPAVIYSIWASLTMLDDGRSYLAEQTAITRSAAGTVERTPGSEFPGADSGFPLLIHLHRDAYLEAVRRHGDSVSFSRAEIEASTPSAREVARLIELSSQPGR